MNEQLKQDIINLRNSIQSQWKCKRDPNEDSKAMLFWDEIIKKIICRIDKSEKE